MDGNANRGNARPRYFHRELTWLRFNQRVQAEAEAEANKMIAASLTGELIEYQKVLRWNGSLPQVQTGGAAYPIIDIGLGTDADTEPNS